MRTYEPLALWTNDPLIGTAAAKILEIARKHNNPVTPWRATPHEFAIPFEYRYDADDDKQQQLLRRVGVLFSALDIHCYFRDRRQSVGVLSDPAAAESKAWSSFTEEALEVILLHCEALPLK